MADKINAAIQKELEKRWEDTDTTIGFVNPCTVASIASELRNSAYDNVKSSKNFNSERYAFAAALFFFNEEGDYKKIPYRIKYEGDILAGRHFGRMLGDRLSSAEWFQDIDTIIPVPLHWRSKWKRGYNQAEIIAQGISEALGIPVRTDILRRRKHTRTQINLNIQQKSANVAGAFSASLPQTRSTNADNSSNRTYRPRHILLVDDVFTTGSTLTACLLALREVFPPEVRISVATLGFVGRF
jgi:ComF family protein